MINLSLSKNSINAVKNKFINIKKNMPKVNYYFMRVSCRWISKEANTILDNSINFQEINTAIRTSWSIQPESANKVRLVNTDDVSAYVEFGTGQVGEQNPHVASSNANYRYNVPSSKKKENKLTGEINWTFKLPNGNYITFNGYVGKAFLYKAFRKYVDSKIYEKIYEQCFVEINKEFL